MRAENSSLLHETVELARALIRIPSFNPPGNEAAIASFASDWLQQAGVSSTRVPLEAGRSSLVARLPGAHPGSIVLCGHLDTVTTASDSWHHDPFGAVIEDGRLWGLGAADMKAGVAVLMQALARRTANSSPLEKSLVLVLTADEEWGYRGADAVARSGLIDDAELVLIAEPTSNAVCVGQKGELWTEAVFTGKEAHGSMPESGTSAILPAARFCLRLHEEISQWPAEPRFGRTTLNIGRVDGGRQVNIVPDRACVQLDVRPISHEHALAAIKCVAQLGSEEASMAGCHFVHRQMGYHRPVLSDVNHPWARKLIEMAAAATGVPQPHGLSPYSTDAVSIVPVLNVPVLICGPGSIEQAHQPNEFIDVEQIAQALEIITGFIA
ncbi:M20 family metallopeptidase [Candidatus Bipolaricaulota bacterium]|nr:M20 family metallopeptidase [Candidatus Bipolaricaulota bacterium]